MAAISFKRSSLEDFNKYNSMLVGNAFTPPPVPSAYDLLETEILASDASSVTFTGLDAYSNYKHLQIRMVVKSTASSPDRVPVLRLGTNGSVDTGANYASHALTGDGSSVSSINAASETKIQLSNYAVSSSTPNAYGAVIVDLLDVFESKNKTLRFLCASYDEVGLESGLYINTSPITDIQIGVGATFNLNYAAGSRFSLYGIKAA